MRDLKDYSLELESLDISLMESILDDDLIDATDKIASREWLTKYASGKYKLNKTGYSIKINGDLIIDGFDGATIPITIFNVRGSLSIVNCPNLKTIKGLIDFSIDGGLYIENCPSLETLEGCPKIVGGDFSCIGNRKIKSLAGGPESVFGEVHVMKNGKKFSEEYIKSLIKDCERVNCSDESIEVPINEALTEPHLLKFAQQLYDERTESKHTKKFSDVLPTGDGIQYDKITSKDVKVFKSYQLEDMLKECRIYISEKKDGIILLQDQNGRYWGVIWRKSIYLMGMYGFGRYSVKSTELLNYCKKADKVVTIDVSGVYNYNMKNERIAARKDMVVYSEQYNEKVARDNVNRYKTILAKRRSLGDINFDDIDNQVQEVVAKVLMVSRMVHKNPAKYADSSYKISYLNNWVYDQERYDKGKTYGKDGLLKLYDRLTNCFLNIQNEKDDRITRYYAKQIDSIKTQITDIINIIKSDLKYFGL